MAKEEKADSVSSSLDDSFDQMADAALKSAMDI